MLNTTVLNTFKSYIGEGGSRAWKYCGMSSGAWCDAEVSVVFNNAGAKSLWFGKQTYCPTSIKLCQANMAMLPPYLAMGGDVIFFDWNANNVPDHIGMVVAPISSDSISTIEGNTGSPARVRYKTRPSKYILGVFRPHYKPQNLPTSTVCDVDGVFGYDSIFALQKALKVTADCILGKDTVKALQKKAGTSADGQWGKGTSKAVQKMVGTTVDGAFGKNSVKALQTWINKQNSPSEGVTETGSVQEEDSATVSEVETTEAKNLCIDTSYWQGKHSVEDWKKVAETCDFAIHRASYTSQAKFVLNDDSTFLENFKNAQSAGIKCGAYHYSQAITVAEAKAEAEYLCNRLAGLTPDFYVVCDYEFGKRLNSEIGTKASEIANAFCDVVKAHGYNACIYGNLSMMNKYLTNPNYPVWLAQYSSKCDYTKSYVMWQYTSSGSVSGISGKVDLSHVYTEPTPTPEKKGYDGTFPDVNVTYSVPKGQLISDKANEIAWSSDTSKANYSGGDSTSAFKTAINKAYPNRSSWGTAPRKGASCDVAVGTAVRASGVDSAYPRGLDEQKKHLPKSIFKKTKVTKVADLKEGDIFYYTKGTHTAIYSRGKSKEAGLKHYYMKTLAKASDRLKKSGYYVWRASGTAVKTRAYLCKGDKNDNVKLLQAFLNWYGSYGLDTDGDFGAKTETAVKDFQTKTGLTVDGQFGTASLAKAKAVVK